MCVVGEFQTYHYKIPADIITDPAPILLAHGFIYANPKKALSVTTLFITHTIEQLDS